MDEILDKLLQVLIKKDRKIETMYFELKLNTLKYTEKYKTLEDCINTSDELILENLKKIYQIPNSNETEEKSKIVKEHKGKSIEKIFNVFKGYDKEILSKIIGMKEIKKNKKNISIIGKMCMLGLCFKIKNNEGTDGYYIPQEVKEIWNKIENSVEQEENIYKINNIIKMSGVIKKENLYQTYKTAYNININYEDFKLYTNVLSIIDNSFYIHKGCFVNYSIEKDKAEKYLRIQEKNECDLKIMNKSDIIDLYEENEFPISPIGFELLNYVETLKTDIGESFPVSIIILLKEQLKFDANEILDEVYQFIPALSKSTKTKIMEYIIRMYHDTRLYKYKGFKPFEIGAYLTDEEIEKIENKLEIKFEDKNYLRLEDIYPDYLSEEFEKQKENEDGTITYFKTMHFTQYHINKSKKFATYLKEKKHAELEILCETYCAEKRFRIPSIDKEVFIEYIDENKEEILKYNYATLEEDEFSFINKVIKNEGYMKLCKNDLEDEFFEVLYGLIRKGLIFTRGVTINKEKFVEVHIPKDSLEIIKNLFSTYNYKTILNLRTLLAGISNAYGVITKTQARKIVANVKSDFLKLFDEFACIINYSSDTNYCMNISNIIKGEKELLSIKDLDIDYMKKLLAIQGEYKIYTYNAYIELAEGTYERKTSAYIKLKKYMNEYFRIEDIQEIEYLIDNYHFEQQTNEYKAREKLELDARAKFSINILNADSMYNEIITMIINVSNQMPQWNLKGNIKEKEMQKQENNERKMGRNELCWCGSGKKYKKCHGRN